MFHVKEGIELASLAECWVLGTSLAVGEAVQTVEVGRVLVPDRRTLLDTVIVLEEVALGVALDAIPAGGLADETLIVTTLLALIFCWEGEVAFQTTCGRTDLPVMVHGGIAGVGFHWGLGAGLGVLAGLTDLVLRVLDIGWGWGCRTLGDAGIGHGVQEFVFFAPDTDSRGSAAF